MEIVSDEVVECISNEYADILEAITERVIVERLKAPAGSLCLWKFMVKAPTYYITGQGDTHPKATDSIEFFVDVKNGFPEKKPYVYYNKGKILASVNAYTTGGQCIDDWLFDRTHAAQNSTLLGTVRKTIMDIIHDPCVSNYDSMANSSLKNWQKDKVLSGEFPTCQLSSLLRSEADIQNGRHSGIPKLPNAKASIRSNPPALPIR